MIGLEELRTALRADAPSTEFDRLIRRELAAGRPPMEVYKAITAHFPVIDDWPEYDGDGYDDLNNALDALTGWCHPDCRYAPAAAKMSPPVESGQSYSGWTNRIRSWWPTVPGRRFIFREAVVAGVATAMVEVVKFVTGQQKPVAANDVVAVALTFAVILLGYVFLSTFGIGINNPAAAVSRGR